MRKIPALTKKHKLAILKLLTATVIWGAAGPVIKYTLQYIPPFTFLFLRFLVAAVLVTPFLLIEEKKNHINKRDFLNIVVLSLLGGFLTLALVFVGFNLTTSLEGSLISATAPIFILVASATLLKEKVTKYEKYGALISIAGTVFIVFEPFFVGNDLYKFDFSKMMGNLLILLSVLTWTAHTILAKKTLDHAPSKLGKIMGFFHLRSETKRYSPFLLTGIMVLVTLIATTPLAFLESSNYLSNPIYNLSLYNLNFIRPLLGVLFMGIFSTIIAYSFYESAIKEIEVAESAVYSYLAPLFAVPFAYLLLGEVVNFWFIAGSALIATGVFVSEKR